MTNAPYFTGMLVWLSLMARLGLFCLLMAGFSPRAKAGELTPPPASAPKVAAASDEGQLAMKGVILQPGFKLELIAAEPHLANPVAFQIDNSGRIFVVETFRLHAGVTDIRGHMDWLDEDLAARTVEDRLALMKRHEGVKFPSYEEHSDRLKLLIDDDGDGKVDRSTVFADGFNHALDGIAAGVLSHKGNVHYANLPNLWLLRDKDGDGKADERRSLHYGYGVRVGFLGHDLHGLAMGPEGKIYFSIGDRGANVEQDGRHIGDPDTGSVFRCNPDGSELEVFATGLRNPQELAFDKYGNLFTGDNNSDGGDRARLVYLVEGGDSGWRIGYQFIERPNSRGPWNAEKLWHPRWEGQAAWIIPPITNLTDGPSGFAYYPGTGLPEKYKDHFFLVDFHGGRSSGIHSFTFKPNGAGFELANAEKFLWNALPTDVSFGLEPGIYFSDWVQGWGMTGKGRIYRAFQPDAEGQNRMAQTKAILLEGMGKRSLRQLAKLLSHQDMRVRQEAQFELVSRGKDGVDMLARVAAAQGDQLARIHAIWGVGQGMNESQRPALAKTLIQLAQDADPEIRAQACKVLGEKKISDSLSALQNAMTDPSPRVRYFGALSLGKLGEVKSVPQFVELLRQNNNEDVYIRHACALSLARIGDMAALSVAAKDSSPAVRLGVVLALRHLERSEIGAFLLDANPSIVLEAARAINDLPINGAMQELAELETTLSAAAPPELARRVLNANYRLGTKETAAALARVAANANLPENIRAEAVNRLAEWEHPSGRDQVTGMWRPVVGERKTEHAVSAIRPHLASLITQGPGVVSAAAARATAKLQMASAGEALDMTARNQAAPASARVESLRALALLKDARLDGVLQMVKNDSSEAVRKEALKLQSQLQPSDALAQLKAALTDGTVGEKQSAFATLANLPDSAADHLLAAWMDQLLQGKVRPEIQLDLLDAASKRNSAAVKDKVKAYESSLSKVDSLAGFRTSLLGGNVEEGRKIFFERAEAACLRCHKVNGEGGEVGPDLTAIGSRQKREYLLESIVLPNKQIAQGFESLIVSTKDGLAFAGVVKSENENELVLNSPEDGIITLKKSDITKRERGLSSMPEGLATLLSRKDLRDLVEYLSTLR